MADIPKLLTGWQADKLGLFQGTPSSAGEFVDVAIAKVRSRKVPKVEPLATAWPRWEEGKPYPVDEAELAELKQSGKLPGNVTYTGVGEDEAEPAKAIAE